MDDSQEKPQDKHGRGAERNRIEREKAEDNKHFVKQAEAPARLSYQQVLLWYYIKDNKTEQAADSCKGTIGK
jgi:hypothetical protein